MPNALHIPLKPSRLWLTFVLVLHVIAVLCVVYSGLSVTLTAMLLALLILHAGFYLRSGLKLAIQSIQHDESGFSLVLAKCPEPVSARFSPSSRLNRFCSVLRFRTCTESRIDGFYTVILCPDSADPQLLRQLRVLLYTGQYQDSRQA